MVNKLLTLQPTKSVEQGSEVQVQTATGVHASHVDEVMLLMLLPPPLSLELTTLW